MPCFAGHFRSMVSLTKPRNIFSGVAEGVYIASRHSFAPDGIKKPLPKKVVVAETHEFQTANDGFIYAQLAPQKNSITSSSIGELGGQQMQHELKVFFPGSYEEVHETVADLLNDPLIVLIKDSNCAAGFYYQLGNCCVGAWMKSQFTTGTTSEGVKGYELTIVSWSRSIVMYTGGVQVKEDFPAGTYPVFSANSINNTSIYTMRNSYLASPSRNITTIYNLALSGQNADADISLRFRNSAGIASTTQLDDTDISTYSKFIAWLASVLPVGTTLQPYSAGLLVAASTTEHYLGLQIRTRTGLLLDWDGGYLVDGDGGRLYSI